ncbi:MAG: RDD family protein [Puniceicoccales bacterium]|jgi:uncharacterized RDD family membrane protein YckC|nr:RDD family protein [Puniceicoccales bacterium]
MATSPANKQPETETPPPPDTDDNPAIRFGRFIESAEEQVAKVAPEMAPAPFVWRALAYLFDWFLGLLLFVALLCWFIPEFYPSEWTSLRNWFNDWMRDYMRLVQTPAASLSDALARNRDVVAKAARMPEPARELRDIVAIAQLFYFWGYFSVVEYFTKGASFGKRIFNLRVASTNDFRAPGPLDSVMRSAWKALFFCSSNPLFLLVGIVDAHVPLFNKLRLSWHDRLTHTIVLDATQSPPPDELKQRGNEDGEDDLEDIM